MKLIQCSWENLNTPRPRWCEFSFYLVCSFFFKFYSSTWPSCLADLLSLRLVGAVGAGRYVKSSYSQGRLTGTWIRAKAPTVASPVFLPLNYPILPKCTTWYFPVILLPSRHLLPPLSPIQSFVPKHSQLQLCNLEGLHPIQFRRLRQIKMRFSLYLWLVEHLLWLLNPSCSPSWVKIHLESLCSTMSADMTKHSSGGVRLLWNKGVNPGILSRWKPSRLVLSYNLTNIRYTSDDRRLPHVGAKFPPNSVLRYLKHLCFSSSFK